MSDINQGSPEPIRDELPQQEPVAREHSGPVKHDPLDRKSTRLNSSH